MSYFYLKPAKGDVPVHLLEEIVIKRLEYLQNLSSGETSFYNEYVIEGSVYDNVGHFTLCIVSALLENTDFSQFFLNTEVMLFNQRISHVSAYDLRSFTKKLIQIIRKLEVTWLLIEPLLKLCRHLSLKNVASHVCSSQHTEDCTLHNIKLHFKHCLMFVSRRQVQISKGFASIPCGRWKQYLTTLFKKALVCRIRQAQKYSNENDPRLAQILLIVKKNLQLHIYPTNAILNKDVDKFTKYFPPCMLNLHQCLRRTHRLSHDQRFYYGLFLKDIGMPVEEAIGFWKSEYSQVPVGTHKCTHSWETDEKKFVYSIRHMYGLEGKRTNYASTNCQRMQNMEASCHEGGCPFKSFDDNNMLHTLKLSVTETTLTQIFCFKKKEMYTSACLLYLESNLKTVVNSNSFNINFSPIKYFTLAYENSK